MTRRELLRRAGGFVAATALPTTRAAGTSPPPRSRPVVIASANGLRATRRAYELLTTTSTDVLDAVIAGVNIIEDDPNDRSVGLGGVPNEEGVVELDASVMHGPLHKAGAVGALRNIRNPSSVARLVMLRTDHVFLVGDGARRFALAHGFREENLLTDESRRIWLRWKESLSDRDDWLPPSSSAAPDAPAGAHAAPPHLDDRLWGTVHVSAVTATGDLAGATSTSGLAFKIPGRVGDSPIIGAGLYTDNDVGSAGATGRGEAVILNCGAFAVVQAMADGLDPTEACLKVIRRIADRTEPRLRDDKGRPAYDVKLYALRKDGAFGCASIWSGGRFAVTDASGHRLEDAAFLFERVAAPQE